MKILLMKETRAGEQRVALIPSDVGLLIRAGHRVTVESSAGLGAGFTDQLYEAQGAEIRSLTAETQAGFQQFFEGIQIIIRAKRPDRSREILENAAMPHGMIMIGALDPFEQGSPHLAEYREKALTIHSLDQLSLPVDDPMNLLAAMSKIAGKLAVQDAISRCTIPPKRAVIVGFGVIGQASLEELLHHKIACTVCVTQRDWVESLKARGCEVVLLNKADPLTHMQHAIKKAVEMADIVITSARAANQKAPLLIPESTLDEMKRGAVIVDMAISEGGNVEGSHHDETHVLGNGVIVTNVSGYPKKVPHEASVLWSLATRCFVQAYYPSH